MSAELIRSRIEDHLKRIADLVRSGAVFDERREEAARKLENDGFPATANRLRTIRRDVHARSGEFVSEAMVYLTKDPDLDVLARVENDLIGVISALEATSDFGDAELDTQDERAERQRIRLLTEEIIILRAKLFASLRDLLQDTQPQCSALWNEFPRIIDLLDEFLAERPLDNFSQLHSLEESGYAVKYRLVSLLASSERALEDLAVHSCEMKE